MKQKAEAILANLIAEGLRAGAKWTNSRFAGITQIPTTNRGEVAEKFAAALLREIGYADAEQKDNRRGQWDVKAGGQTFEVKMASEDIGGAFQFNGIRYDTQYDLLLVVGVAPDDILFRVFQRRELIDLPLTPMAKGTSGTYKLTRRREQLLTIDEFENEARKFIDLSKATQKKSR